MLKIIDCERPAPSIFNIDFMCPTEINSYGIAHVKIDFRKYIMPCTLKEGLSELHVLYNVQYKDYALCQNKSGHTG